MPRLYHATQQYASCLALHKRDRSCPKGHNLPWLLGAHPPPFFPARTNEPPVLTIQVDRRDKLLRLSILLIYPIEPFVLPPAPEAKRSWEGDDALVRPAKARCSVKHM